MADCRLEPVPKLPSDLVAMSHAAGSRGLRSFLHKQDGVKKVLIVTTHTTRRDLETAHALWLGHRDWRTVSVGRVGSLRERLADQRKIGRQRAPRERSPVALPDWYDLTHVVYGHAAELGFDPTMPVFLTLPGTSQEYVNFAEALHLDQPI